MLYRTILSFNKPRESGILKALWGKEKMLESNAGTSHNFVSVHLCIHLCRKLVSVKLLAGVLTHSQIHDFETVPNSKMLQTTTELWLLKDFKIQIAEKTIWKKVKLLILSNFTFLYARRRRDVLCYHPWRAGGIPHSLSGANLQDYASYGYETSWVDRSHQGGVQCTGTITLACLIFELLPFVYFHT